jgi:flagellar hook-associated protein 3 FlgL
MRVTQQSIASSVLNGLQGNITRLGETQQRLSSGKLITKPSDSPSGTVSAMALRSDLAATRQYSRNADDGLGWLTAADTALTSSSEQINRARDLVLQGMSTGSAGSPDAREALAVEVDGIRDSLIGLANSTYLGRPVFGGTTAGTQAFDTSGAYVGDDGNVNRTVGANTKVRVDVPGLDVYGADPNERLFKVLSDISGKLRNNPAGLKTDLDRLDKSTQTVRSSLAGIGTRYNQVMRMRQAADDGELNLTSTLSGVEDIDLPKTITELQLQQTAYQAALQAGARVVQPSLLDFLR